jgi:hypothetical protein
MALRLGLVSWSKGDRRMQVDPGLLRHNRGMLGPWPITACKKIQLHIAFQHLMLISCSATPCVGFACSLNTKKRRSGCGHGPFDRPSWYLAAHAFCPREATRVSLPRLCRSRPFRVLEINRHTSMRKHGASDRLSRNAAERSFRIVMFATTLSRRAAGLVSWKLRTVVPPT